MRFLILIWSVVWIAGFLILMFSNNFGRIQTPNLNQIDTTRIQDGPSLDQDQDADGRPTPDLTKPGPLSAPPHIYADPNSSNKCILGSPTSPMNPQRVNPHCA